MATFLQTRLRNVLKSLTKPQTGWLDEFPAVVGKFDGTIQTGTAGVIWVRNILNGQPISVHNSIAPTNTWGLQVQVGRRVDTPNLWQVKGVRESFSVPAAGGVIISHGDQHTFPASDTTFVDRKQLLPLTVLVSDAAAFLVQLYAATASTKAGTTLIDNQELDLSTYVPDNGAIILNIEVNDAGVISFREGTQFGDISQVQASDYPQITDHDKYLLATVGLSSTMTELADNDIRVTFPLETNYLLDTAAFTGILNASTDIQGAFEVLDLHTHEFTVEEPITLTDEPLLPLHSTHPIAGALAATTGVAYWQAPQDGIISSILAYILNNGTADSTTIDVHLNGTTVFTTQDNRPSIANDEATNKAESVPDVTSFARGDIISFDIDSIATGASDLLITIEAYALISSLVFDEDGSIVTVEATYDTA